MFVLLAFKVHDLRIYSHAKRDSPWATMFKSQPKIMLRYSSALRKVNAFFDALAEAKARCKAQGLRADGIKIISIEKEH